MPSINKINRFSTISKLRSRHEHCGGFGATTAVLLISFGMLAMSLAALGAAGTYADQVSARELRIQAALDQQACDAARALVQAKDAFVSGTVRLPGFGCTVSF